jgi:hypothetical protein
VQRNARINAVNVCFMNYKSKAINEGLQWFLETKSKLMLLRGDS